MPNLKHISCLFLLLIGLSATAQHRTDRTLVRIETPVYQKNSDTKHYYYIPMDFNNAEAYAHLDEIDVSRIESVTLVYTQFKSSERFNQLQLNEERTVRLHQVIPSLQNNKEIKWFWVAQTQCNSPGDCKEMFHGFEIRLKTDQEIASAKEERAMFDFYADYYANETIGERLLGDTLPDDIRDEIYKCDTITIESGSSRNRFPGCRCRKGMDRKKYRRKLNRQIAKDKNACVVDLNLRGQYESVSNTKNEKKARRFEKSFKKYFKTRPARYEGKRMDGDLVFHLKRNKRGRVKSYTIEKRMYDKAGKPIVLEDRYHYTYEKQITCPDKETIIERYGYYGIDTTTYLPMYPIYENVVKEVFDRNTELKNCLVAADVTGSMAPYMGQLVAWYELNMEGEVKNKDFVFFNDGDNMADFLKKPGKVGGIYHVQTTDFAVLKQKMEEAQSRGGGGDAPENNVEAVIKGLKKNDGVEGIIMIADNWATPRDLKLLRKVDKPIHVIVCGAGNINPDYVNLAHASGGTIHTMEQDLANLSKLSDGDTIEIGGTIYLLKDGEFVVKATPMASSF